MPSELVGLRGFEPRTSALSVLFGVFGVSAAMSDCAANQDFSQPATTGATPSKPPHPGLSWAGLGQEVVKGGRKMTGIWPQ